VRKVFIQVKKRGVMKKFALVMLLTLGVCAVSSSAFAISISKVVAPEPISMTLFLLGGAGLAVSKMFSKKSDK